MQPRTKELLDHLDACRADLRAAVESVPASLRDRHPEPDRWSVANVLEHLSIVEGRVARTLAEKIAAARAAGLGEERDQSPILPTIDLARFVDRRNRIKGIAPIMPSAGMTADAAWSALERTRERMREAVFSADGLAIGELTQPHPIFGPLSLYEFIAFVGGHEARHGAQIREIGEELRASARA
jgi:hypothetical protein